MKLEAVLHTPLSKDAYMLDERTLAVRLRAAKGDLGQAEVFYGDRVCMTEPIDVTGAEMKKIASDELFDYFEAVIESDFTRICYYFKLTDKKECVVYYSEYGFSREMECHRTQYFQFPYLRKEDMFSAPEWTKNMVMYHIFPDSFADGKRRISSEGKRYEAAPGVFSESRNGGTLRGIIENLDYLRELQVNCLYLNPIFLGASYHKYDTIDYREIDPCFGTKEDLKELVRQCHESGIYVILDGVFNHCGSGFFAFRDVLKNGEASPYCDWFYKLRFPIAYKNPPNYEAFAYVREMPKLNTGNKEVEQYFCEIGRYWIREAGIDGWRLDVANEINHDFWRAFAKAVKQEKTEVFLIGEIWEDSTVWLLGDQFDSTMNYSFSYLCREYFAEKKITVSQFDEKISRMNLRYPETVSRAQMNFLDTHDVPRFLSYCGGDVSKLKLAVFYMMMAVGIPSVFYGDERGIAGVSEAEYRKVMPWQENTEELTAFYRKWIGIRRETKALSQGNYRTLAAVDEEDIYIFKRSCKEEQVLVVINAGEEERRIDLRNYPGTENPGAVWVDLESKKTVTNPVITCGKMQGRAWKRVIGADIGSEQTVTEHGRA